MGHAVAQLASSEDLADGEWTGMWQQEVRGLKCGDVVHGVVDRLAVLQSTAPVTSTMTGRESAAQPEPCSSTRYVRSVAGRRILKVLRLDPVMSCRSCIGVGVVALRLVGGVVRLACSSIGQTARGLLLPLSKFNDGVRLPIARALPHPLAVW